MEIYKAAGESNIEWRITKYPLGWVIESVEYISDNGEDGNFITKQRGGIRYFKSCDAALNAIEQIGQTSVTVKLDCFK